MAVVRADPLVEIDNPVSSSEPRAPAQVVWCVHSVSPQTDADLTALAPPVGPLEPASALGPAELR